MRSKDRVESSRESKLNRGVRRACVLAMFAVLIAWAPAALAGTKTLRWTHPDPATVDGFRVHTSVSGGAFDAGTDVAKPAPSQGIYAATVTVPDGVPVELRMSAYSNASGLTSSLSVDSNSLFLLGAPGKPTVIVP